MPRILPIGLAALMIALSAAPASAWPADAYDDIFRIAVQTMPPALQRLIADLDPAFREPCGAPDPVAIEPTAASVIQELSSPAGNLQRAVRLLRTAGCATAALNDPSGDTGLGDAIDALVQAQLGNFAVVFYGWHPLIREGNLSGYLEVRLAEHRKLQARFGRSSELPNLSEQVELSPEFGLASIAFSHAVTDVANVWLYIWASANGAR